MTCCIKKFVSVFLAAALFATFSLPAFASFDNTSLSTNEVGISNDEKQNLTFLEGKLGETHLLYTYEEGGRTYKVEESATPDFSEVKSDVFILNEDNEYELLREIESTSAGDAIEIATTESQTQIEKRTVTVPDMYNYSKEESSTRSANEWEWVTEYVDGNTYLGNITVLVIIQILTKIANNVYPQASLVSESIAVAASALFSANAKYVYYHKICNSRHSDRNYLVMEATEYTKYYEDAAHTIYVGDAYAEYLDE